MLEEKPPTGEFAATSISAAMAASSEINGVISERPARASSPSHRRAAAGQYAGSLQSLCETSGRATRCALMM
jgi:hypothetical protein